MSGATNGDEWKKNAECNCPSHFFPPRSQACPRHRQHAAGSPHLHAVLLSPSRLHLSSGPHPARPLFWGLSGPLGQTRGPEACSGVRGPEGVSRSQ